MAAELTKDFLETLPEDREKFHEVLTQWRHELHEHPETSMEEVWTSDYVAKILETLGLEVTRNVGGNGIVATLTCGDGKKIIGLRSELDALNMTDESGAEYSSKIPGKAHCCGHDGHMVMLLGAAIQMAHDKNFNGTVRFLFQPGEEDGKGAKAVIADHYFDRFPCDEMYTMHNAPQKAFGTISACPGGFNASEDDFEIKIKAHGGHAAKPHLSTDPMIIASEIVMALQTIVARNVDPQDCAVISCTEIHTDGSHNAIGSNAVITGDTRSYSPKVQDLMERRMKEICEHICEMNHAECEFTYSREYAPTVNDKACLANMMKAAAELWGSDCTKDDDTPSMGSEDFGAFIQIVPGCTVDIGTGENLVEGHIATLHNTHFNFNDKIIMHGVDLWCQLVEDLLK